MIDTDKYDNEGIELSDRGTICFPEDDGRIQRIDKDGNIMQTLHPEDTEWQEWYELFDTHKDLLAEVQRLRKKYEPTETKSVCESCGEIKELFLIKHQGNVCDDCEEAPPYPLSDEGDERMINTDKYEGHTEGPWFIEYEENNGMRVFICSKGATILWQCETTHTDAQLIADAPLLLQEVKRLREAIADVATNMEAADASYMGGFIEDLWKVIE